MLGVDSTMRGKEEKREETEKERTCRFPGQRGSQREKSG